MKELERRVNLLSSPLPSLVSYCPLFLCHYHIFCIAQMRKVLLYRGILVYNICLISISNSVSDRATNESVLNIERS